ncbi:MAG: S8 family peptidase [Chloroflexota bacterium]|nr:S8 family peptidase [Chloroflexota bacterium]
MQRRSFGWILLLVMIGLGVWSPLSQATHAAPGASTSAYFPVVLVPATPTPAPTATPVPEPPYGSVIPNDPYFRNAQWNLERVRAAEGWSISTGRDVTIAIIDTGVDYRHPDLAGRFVDPSVWYDFSENDRDPMDGNGHGTHVAGIAAAATNNGQGVAGTSWGGRILPLKVLRDDGSGYLSWSAAAVKYAADHGARVINMSLGGRSPNAALQSEILAARARGVVVVASAGNCHAGSTSASCNYTDDAPSYPGKMDGVLAVAGTTRSDAHAPYSTVGGYVDVAAPGGDSSSSSARVYSTLRNGSYGGLSGTSMAAPHVSGLAALILGEVPWWSAEQVEALILDTAVDLGSPGKDPYFGAGLIDVRRALESVWYQQATAVDSQAAGEASPLGEDLATLATDCDIPHASDRLLVQRSSAGKAALDAVPDGVSYRVLANLTAWQVLQIPDGQACGVMKALNAAGKGAVAELDVIISAE